MEDGWPGNSEGHHIIKLPMQQFVYGFVKETLRALKFIFKITVLFAA
jgi:hypothetical protein